MPADKIIEFNASPIADYGGQPVTVELRADTAGTLIGGLTAATPGVDKTSVWTVAFDAPAGRYEVIVFDPSGSVAVTDFVIIEAAAGTYPVESRVSSIALLNQIIAIVSVSNDVELSPESIEELSNAIINRMTAALPQMNTAVQGKFTIVAGDTWSQIVLFSAPIADRIVVAIKSSRHHDDECAMFLMDSVTGILRVNGEESVTPELGSVTSDGVECTISVSSTITDMFEESETLLLTLKALSDTSDQTYERGLIITRSPIKAITAI